MSWRRILLLSFALVAVLAVATWLVVKTSGAPTQLVRRALAELLAIPADLDEATIDLGAGSVALAGVRLAAAPQGLDVRVGRVELDAGFGAGGDLLGVHAVRVLDLDAELGPDLPDPAALLRRAPAPRAATANATPHIPAIALRNGRLRLRARADGEPFELADVQADLVPRRDGPGLALHAEARLVDPPLGVQIVGVVDPATGALAATADLAATTLDEALVARILRRFDATPPEFAVGAQLQTLRLRLERAAAAAPLRASLEAGLRDVRVAGASIPTIVTDADVDLQASTDDGGTARLRLVQRTGLGALDVVAGGRIVDGQPKFDVQVHGEDLRIDREVVRALELFPTGRQVVAALAPTAGRADLDLFIENPHERGGATDLDLRLRDVAVTFLGFGTPQRRVGFPLPMGSARGRVRLRDRVLLLDDIHSTIAERAGGGVVHVSGRVDTDKPSGEDVAIDITADGVAFTPDLRAALSTLLRDDGALYDKFAPTGRADVRVAVRPGSVLPGGWSVDIALADAAMRWAGFPYPLLGLRGGVHAREDGVRFDLAGAHGDGRLQMRGFLPLTPAAWQTHGFDADVRVDGVAVDGELRDAVAVLAPELLAPWRRSEAAGRLDGDVRVWRDAETAPLRYDADIDVRDVELALPAAPWRARGLGGRIRIEDVDRGTRVAFDGVAGALTHGDAAPARLAMLGSLLLGDGPDASGEELAFVVRGLALDEQLGRTLEELGALGPGTWRQLRPSGRVDLTCRHRRGDAGAAPLQLEVELLGVRSDAPMLPRPAERIVGVLHVDGGEVRFDGLQARLGGADVRVRDGRIRTLPAPDGRSEIAFTVDAADVPIDDGIANLFAGPLQRAVLQRQLLGTADLDGLRLRFCTPTGAGGGATETTIAGGLRLYDLDVTLGTGADSLVVEGIRGAVELADSTVGDAGGALRGSFRGASLRLFGQPLEAIDADFLADAERIEIARLVGRLHGGRLQGGGEAGPALRYRLPCPAEPDGALAADVAFADVDVNLFLAASGWRQPPYRGAAAGAIRLQRLAGSDVVGAAGDGELRLTRADLGVVPLFTAIYAQLPAADQPRFDGLDLAFQVRDGVANFPRLEVRSNVLAARGAGTLGFDGYLDVGLTLANLLGDSADPFVMPLLSYLAQNIVTFHLHGYLNDLQAEKRWLTEDAPTRRGIAPTPPAARPARRPGA